MCGFGLKALNTRKLGNGAAIEAKATQTQAKEFSLAFFSSVGPLVGHNCKQMTSRSPASSQLELF